MGSGLPQWLVTVVRDGFDATSAARTTQRIESGEVTPAALRVLLLVPLAGPQAAAVREAAFAHVRRHPHLAPSVVSAHVQSTRLALPRIETRSEGINKPFSAQVSVQVGEDTVASGWCTGRRKKDAQQHAYVNLLANLLGWRDQAEPPPGRVPAKSGAAGGLGRASNPQARSQPSITLASASRRSPRSLAAMLNAVAEILRSGGDVIFDQTNHCLQSGLLCPLPATGHGTGLPATVTRQLLLPGGEVSRVGCLRLEVASILPVLLEQPAASWSESMRFWAQSAQMAVSMIKDGRMLPTSTHRHFRSGPRSSWLPGQMSLVAKQEITAHAADHPSFPRCLIPAAGTGDLEPASALEAVRGFFEAVADRFSAAGGSAYLPGAIPTPVRLGAEDPIEPLQDVPAAACDDTPGCQLIIQISEPDSLHRLRARLRLASLPECPDTAVDAAEVWTDQAHAPVSDPELLYRTRRALWLAGRVCAPLRLWGLQTEPSDCRLRLEDALDLRRNRSALHSLGISIDWHKDWIDELHPQLTVSASSPPPVHGRLSLGDLLDRRWQFTLDGSRITDRELTQLATAAHSIIRLRSRWIFLDDDVRDKLAMPHLPQVPLRDALLDVLTGIVTIDGRTYACRPVDGLADQIEELRSGMQSTATHPQVRIPQFSRPLYDHQIAAVTWLTRLSSLGLGAVLADDMGLGKTVTALAFHQAADRPHRGLPTLVICPNSDLINNWRKEIALNSTATPVHVYWGAGRHLNGLSADTIVLTTYKLLELDHAHLTAPAWGLVIADEAQGIKNPATCAAQWIRALKAGNRLALTATPAGNTPAEVWSLLDWANPGLFATRQQFISRYVRPLEESQTHASSQAEGILARDVLRPFVFRRLKDDPGLGLSLPKRIDTTDRIPLSEEQTGLYEALHRELVSYLRSYPGHSSKVLRLITNLRQICNSPAHYRGDSPANITSNPQLAAKQAPKLAHVKNLLEQFAGQTESTIIFTTFRRAADLIAAYLQAEGHPALRYYGAMGPRERQASLRAFNESKQRVLIATTQSGGVGHNLTCANHVIHFDRHFNPAVNNQASDRVYRINQTRDVTIHNLRSAGTIEEHIDAMLTRKEQVNRLFLPTGELDYRQLTATELINLCALT